MSIKNYAVSEVTMSRDHWHHFKALIEFTVSTLNQGELQQWRVFSFPYGKGMVDFNKVKLVSGDDEVISARVDWMSSNLVEIQQYSCGKLIASQRHEECEVQSKGNYILSADIQRLSDKFRDPDSLLHGKDLELDSDSIQTLAICSEEGFDDEILAAMAHELSKN
ncbi:hypothetical protein [Vibrio lentus]|uniref:hypothetical protein n=1 Tax=Vibrio lentus TaxID=136468 RepID=UPI0010550829|nr:hypothetical protein [Vibrio lentus]